MTSISTTSESTVHDLRGDPLLTIPELAEITRTSPKTVYDWRLKGVGPASIRVGRAILFRTSDVSAWLDSRRQAA
ncbi:helix-turn-helix domain-containing protein [Cryobacterium sp. PH31-O1]|uniref:helix-turn-helix transcriptional regulator n=1 Tax=Cryobacterium sp. PH31-O1 TaxID=3046306 RepID=UPI0032D901CB